MQASSSSLLKRSTLAIAGVFLMLLILTCAKSTHSAIFACQTGQDVVYQDAPCAIKKSPKLVAKTRNKYPLAIDESWFDIPEQAEERAFCDRGGCECGRIEKNHRNSLVQAIADALYIDGSWHRYTSSYEVWLNTPTSSADSYEAREQMLEASCDVMMSQTLLRNFAEAAMAVLRKQVRTAEERGYDIEQPCLEGIPEACEFFDYVQYYKRIQADSASLRRSRFDSL